MDTPDAGLARAYYMGALLVLYMRNTDGRPDARPMFLTGGPRLGATTTFYWDHSEWARMDAMLDPSGLRAWLLACAGRAVRRGLRFRSARAAGRSATTTWPTTPRCSGSSSRTSAPRATCEFLSATAGRRTVLDHLERLAYGFADRRTEATGGVLADFGPDAWTVLECVPNYVNAMASFNAAYVAMLRSYAALLRFLGRDPGDAERAARSPRRRRAGSLRGRGRWQIRHPDARETIGHFLDFGMVAASMADDLAEAVRDEMVTFVTDHLLAGPWMRALAADDPIAPFSDRPDHGAGGAFGAWPGVTAYGLAKLGRPDLAATVLGRTPGPPPAVSGGRRWRSRRARAGCASRAVASRTGTPSPGRPRRRRSSPASSAWSPAIPHLRSPQPRPTTVNVPGLGSLSNLNLHPAPQRVGTG